MFAMIPRPLNMASLNSGLSFFPQTCESIKKENIRSFFF